MVSSLRLLKVNLSDWILRMAMNGACHICRQLLRDPNVRFAGYRVPHPLIHDVEIKVQAMDARTTPAKLLESAIEDLGTEADILERQFNVSGMSFAALVLHLKLILLLS